MDHSNFLLAKSEALPPAFAKVAHAKELLRTKQASSTAEATRLAGVSRSMFYKYKDSVYPYNERTQDRIITVQVLLYDKPGVLMSVISQFYSVGANILTINQSIPINGKAMVSISARVDLSDEPTGLLLEKLKEVDGVKNIESIVSE